MSHYHIIVRGNKLVLVNGIKFSDYVGAHRVFRVYDNDEVAIKNFIWSIDHIPSGKMICFVHDWDEAKTLGEALSLLFKDNAVVTGDAIREVLGNYVNNRLAAMKGNEWQHDVGKLVVQPSEICDNGL